MKKLFISNVLFLFMFICYSQQSDKNMRIVYNDKGTIQSVEILEEGGTIQVPTTAKVFFKEYLKIGINDSFILIPHESKRAEFRHEHYDQYYKDVKVDGAGYNFHFKNNKLYFASGNYVRM